ncbi:alpha/beta hydrolase [Nocardioides sp.]|uniref:alpha/beta hydrolase n=1 Tax=Nocardioides sp. TaxID=35761 RepID=UPI002717D56F|nr:alpha/beta hydrolase [Nocardioides sp.]MDO9456580.1 alpha/beta hydrolase [Nocardioides sp.]
MTSHRLVDVRTPSRPACVVLVLHGGAQRQQRVMVSPTQLSVLRMVPVAQRVARAGGGRLAVVRLLNSYRGWDSEHTPLEDAAWAIAQVGERWPGLPVALVGHSLGGRAALLAAEDDAVRTVVALNPWVYPSDGVPLPGRSVLFVHGDEDRIALPERSRVVADRLARSADVDYRVVPGGKHAMLRHGRAFEKAAADFVVGRL